MLNSDILVKTDNFDGPLGLLLLLIEREEMDIKTLDLNRITKQYLDYLSLMRDLNFDVAGDYLYLAATLLLLKSKSCLSEEEKNEMNLNQGDLTITSRAELIRRLEELQRYQKLGQKLWDLPKKGHEIFVRPKMDRNVIIDSILTPIELNKLLETMMDILRKQKRKFTVVKRDRLSIKERLIVFKKYLEVSDQTTFEKLLHLEAEPTVDNVIITFISILELARLGKISVFQNEDKSEIYVNVLSSLKDFDVDLANGFSDENVSGQANGEGVGNEISSELESFIDDEIDSDKLGEKFDTIADETIATDTIDTMSERVDGEHNG